MTCVRRLVLRRWRHCLLICILIVVPLLILQWVMLEEERSKNRRPMLLFESTNDLFHLDWATSGTVPHLLTRALSYCNMPIRPGAEGRSRVNASVRGLKLRAVYVVIRHGDRAAMTSFPKFKYSLPCDIGALRRNSDVLLQTLLDRLSSLAPPRRGFYAGQVGFPNETVCGRGEMSPQGVLQNFLLGYHLGAAYSDLVGGLRGPQELQVVVTRSVRTYHSAAALLEAMLHSRGLDVELSDFAVSPSIAFCNASRYLCVCPKLSYHFSRIRETAAKLRDRPNAARLRYAFSELLGTASEDSALPNLNDLVDATMPLVCNRFRRIMCASDEEGREHCLSHRMVHELWKVHDRMGTELARDPSVIRYGKLVSFPFLDQLLQSMLKVAKADSADNEEEREMVPRVSLFAGHDHTIRYLLTGLGLYDGTWPPLSSRLVWELYGPEGEGRGEKSHRFRLLYNGLVITHQLSFCQTELCPLTRLKTFLNNDFWFMFGTTKYTQACTK